MLLDGHSLGFCQSAWAGFEAVIGECATLVWSTRVEMKQTFYNGSFKQMQV